jgi:hypothetical protein
MPRVKGRPYMKTLLECYHYYREQPGNRKDISFQLYRNICHDFFDKVMAYLVYDSGVFHLPAAVGSIGIQSKKLKRNPYADFSFMAETGKPLKHYNFHTGNQIYTFKWRKMRKIYSIHTHYLKGYRWVPNRQWKRIFAKHLKSSTISPAYSF